MVEDFFKIQQKVKMQLIILFDKINMQIRYLLGFVIIGSLSSFSSTNANEFNVNSTGSLIISNNVNNTNGVCSVIFVFLI